MNNEPCRLCGSEPTVANYYDFYRFHCPTKGCREHLSQGVIVNGIGMWYGSIAEARDAWNTRQRRGEAASAPQTAEPEPEPASAEDEPQDGLEQSDFINCGKPYREGGAVLDAAIIRPMDADGTDNGTCPNGIGQASIDTREKLEADVRDYWYHTRGGWETAIVHEWLDRQAAITHREALCQPDERDEQIAELTAERDKLRREVDALHDACNECEDVERLRDERDKAYKRGYDDGLHANTRAAFSAAKQAFGVDERDRMQRVIDTQRESFRKMEADLKAAEDTANTLRASVAGLKETVETQRGELSRFNAEKRRTKRIPKKVWWPRREDGTLIAFNALEAYKMEFDRFGVTVDYGFGETEHLTYDELREREQAWRNS